MPSADSLLARARRRLERATTSTPPASPDDGPAESRPEPAPERSRLETRRDMIFASAAREGRFLEIGPAHQAILPKRDGFDTQTVDYLDRAGLVEKYSAFEHYDPASIEEVDHVLSPDGTMLAQIEDRFDLVLASHVLEHTTSLIDFLVECSGLLADGGVVALVVPDQRFTFDRFRERSSIGRVIDTHLDPPRVHTRGTLTDFALHAVKHRGNSSWSAGHPGRYRPVHDLDATIGYATQADSGEYVDVHNWVVTPHHLRLLLADLADLGYLGLRECFFHDTVGHEFFLNLSADGPGTGLTRSELVVLADDELRRDRPRFAGPRAELPTSPPT